MGEQAPKHEGVLELCACGAPAAWRRVRGNVPALVCEPCKVEAQRERVTRGLEGAWEPIPRVAAQPSEERSR